MPRLTLLRRFLFRAARTAAGGLAMRRSAHLHLPLSSHRRFRSWYSGLIVGSGLARAQAVVWAWPFGAMIAKSRNCPTERCDLSSHNPDQTTTKIRVFV